MSDQDKLSKRLQRSGIDAPFQLCLNFAKGLKKRFCYVSTNQKQIPKAKIIKVERSLVVPTASISSDYKYDTLTTHKIVDDRITGTV